jgi:hypothetical protein
VPAHVLKDAPVVKGRGGMQLELGIARECRPDGCRVQRMDGTGLDARYAPPVQDKIKVRPGDLVVLDLEGEPPRIVWRWWQGTVEEIEGTRARVSRNVTQAEPDAPRRASHELAVSTVLARQVRLGDTVYFNDDGVIDVARDGLPANPDVLCAERFPGVIAAYAGGGNA